MTAIERTAYPRFPQRPLLLPELEACYTPTKEELHFVQRHLRNKFTADSNYLQYQLNMLALLKSFQQLGYFPRIKEIPDTIVQHIQYKLGTAMPLIIIYSQPRMLYRHQKAIRRYLNVKAYQREAQRLAIKTAFEAAYLHNYPADIINNLLESLLAARFELPAFSQIDRIVKYARYRANQQLFKHISHTLPATIKEQFDACLTKATRTAYHRLKQLPKSTSVSHFKALLAHHDTLLGFGNLASYLEGLSQIKRQHFSGEAKALDASDMRDLGLDKRYTLLACLVHQMQMQAKDNLVLMLIKTMAKIHKKAELKLAQMREQQRKKTQTMLGLLND